MSLLFAVACILTCTSALWFGTHAMWLSLLVDQITVKQAWIKLAREIIKNERLVHAEYYVLALLVLCSNTFLFASLIYLMKSLEGVLKGLTVDVPLVRVTWALLIVWGICIVCQVVLGTCAAGPGRWHRFIKDSESRLEKA